ncbi:MAG: hypothetical protein IJO98_04865 [Clostridia bacterium]|nr:hypothetical protein [Clostridia bacterium]
MKKPLTGWRAVLLVAVGIAVYLAAVFGCGWLLSKVPGLQELKGWEDKSHFGWWVFFGVHLFVSLSRPKEKHPRLARIDSICLSVAAICLGIEGALRYAFDLAGI